MQIELFDTVSFGKGNFRIVLPEGMKLRVPRKADSAPPDSGLSTQKGISRTVPDRRNWVGYWTWITKSSAPPTNPEILGHARDHVLCSAAISHSGRTVVEVGPFQYERDHNRHDPRCIGSCTE
jgi:hypothetical protein